MGRVDLQFPVLGLNTRYGFQSQPPYSTPDCLNVRSFDTREGRQRGGSRPGLARHFHESCLGPLGSAGPIRLMSYVTWGQLNSPTEWGDSFTAESLTGNWSTDAYSGATSLPDVYRRRHAYATSSQSRHAIAPALPISSASEYVIRIFILPYLGSVNGKYRILLGMSNLSPDSDQNGVVVELERSGSNWAGEIRQYVAGTPTSYAFTTYATNQLSGWFSVYVTTDAPFGRVKVKFGGQQMLSQLLGAAMVGQRVGFGLSSSGSHVFCDRFECSYRPTTPIGWDDTQNYKPKVFVSTGSNHYLENYRGQLLEVSGGSVNDLASDRMLHAAQRNGLLYIADNSDVAASGTDGTRGSTTTTFDSPSYADWTDTDIVANEHIIEISASSNETQLISGTYTITSVAAGQLTLDRVCNSGAGAPTCTFSIKRGVKVYDPNAPSITMLTAGTDLGAVPHGGRCICFYRDRLCLAVDHVLHMSRIGDMTDWDYFASESDLGRAFAGNVESRTDTLSWGQPITALIPFGNDYLLIGYESALWVMRGDPNYGGQLDNISRQIGIVGFGAYCRGPEGQVYFLSHDGMYMLSPGSLTPTRVSRDALPNDFRDLNRSQYDYGMVYDVRDRGVHIYLVSEYVERRTNWFFELETGAFWPVRLASSLGSTIRITAVGESVGGSSEDQTALLGHADGFIRSFNRYHERDDGTAIENYVTFGPLRIGGSHGREALLNEIDATLSQDSGDVTWLASAKDTMEGAVFTDTTGSTVRTGTFSAGYNRKARPRCRGSAATIKLTGSGTRAWAMECLTIETEPIGEQKVKQ